MMDSRFPTKVRDRQVGNDGVGHNPRIVGVAQVGGLRCADPLYIIHNKEKG